MASDAPDPLLGVHPGEPGPIGVGGVSFWLRRIGDPEILERVADQMERYPVPMLNHPSVTDIVGSLRSRARFARRCLREIEAAGLRWDFEAARATWPPDGPGRPRELAVDLVGRAFEEIAPACNRRHHADTLAAVRDRLRYVLPWEELSDDKLKDRDQQYGRRADRR